MREFNASNHLADSVSFETVPFSMFLYIESHIQSVRI